MIDIIMGKKDDDEWVDFYYTQRLLSSRANSKNIAPAI